MKKIQVVTICSTLLLLVSGASAQDEVSEWIEEPAVQEASEDVAPVEQPPVKKAKKNKKKKKAKKTVIVTEGQGASVGGSGQTVVVVNQAPARYPTPPPPPPPPPRVKPSKGAYTHDGFYFRGGFDLGAMTLVNASSSSPRASVASFAFGMNFGFGGTLGKGFVLGGRLDTGGGPGPVLYSDGKTYALDGSLAHSSLHLFTDWYVFPKKGLHVEAGVGPGVLGYDPTPDNSSRDRDYDYDDVPSDTESIGGLTGILGIGYDWWVAEQWSLGLLLRLNWGAYAGRVGDSASMKSIEQNEGKGSMVLLMPVVGFTVTYH